ncbi:MAG TPA: HAMP domain-containing sensor histidine kinase [Pilimelia sp.]|nr:HAMP domain-containing sensor histidine kinase [Pilimelia sp.]
MRRRLRLAYLTLLTVVLAGLAVPLAATQAARDTQHMYIDRVNDTARFASLAEPALRTGRTSALATELAQYDELFDIAAIIVGRDGRPVIPSRPGLGALLADPEVQRHLAAALSGDRSGPAAVAWPWRSGPLVVAEPVGRGGEITGAVLTLSPTDELRAAIWRAWAALAGLSLLALLAGAAAATPLADWVLRPVHELDDAAHALAAGRYGSRVAVASGPPELRRLVASFNAMAARIATLLERQRAFVSYASHQLRTPLATLRLSVDNLAPAVRPCGLADHRLVTEEIDRMARICDALLAFARAEATATEVRRMDVARVADSRVAAWRPRAAQSGVRIGRTGPAAVTAVTAADVLDQALDALIDNAVKFAGPGSRVQVAVRPTRQWVDVDVTDNGPGIPPEDLHRAAEAFWRRPTDQNRDGSGLGITIVHTLVSASGGRLILLPARPRGLTARLRLPVCAAGGEAGPAGPEDAEPAPPRPGAGAGARSGAAGADGPP